MAIYYADSNIVGAWLGNYQAVLTADTDTTIAAPTGATHAIFASDYAFWVDDSAITLPSLASFAVTTALKNPTQCIFTAGSTLHVRARLSQDIFITFYS
jgi:hypothetical protein